MKTREASRDNEHKEDVVPRLMFKTLCEGVRQKVRHGHCRRRPPPAAAGRRRPPPAAAGCRRKTRLALCGRCCRRRPTALLRGTWQGRWRRRNGGYICDDNNNDYTKY